MAWTPTAADLPKPDVWLMATLPGREYPALAQLRFVEGEPHWRVYPETVTPLRAYTHWDYFIPAPEAEGG